MEENIVKTIKSLKNNVVGVKNPDHNKPIFGELVDVNDQFITLKDKMGNINIIRISFINAIWPTRNIPANHSMGDENGRRK
jgi:hypothetical protein